MDNSPRSRTPTGWGRVLLLLASFGGACTAQSFFDGKERFSLACALYLASLIIFAVIAARPLWRAFPKPPGGYGPGNISFDTDGLEPQIKPLWEVTGFIAIVIIGTFFRFYRLDAVPPGFNHDSAWLCHYALDFINGKVGLTPYFVSPSHYPIGYETFYPLLNALYICIVGPVPLASKLSAATCGLGALIVVYFLARFMFGKRMALIASFLMSVCGWHFIFSRVGWSCIAVPLWETVAVFLLLAAVKRNRSGLFALAGAATAANLMTYSISRILIVKELAIAAYLWFKKIVTIRACWKGGAVFLAVFLLCSLPVIHYAATHWDTFQGRARVLIITGRMDQEGVAPLIDAFKKTILNFNYRANGNDFFIEEPLLDFPISVFFAFGFVVCCLLFNRPRYGILLIWFLTSLTPGIMSAPNPNHNMGALVPCAIMAAVSCDLAVGFLWRWVSRFWRRAGTALAVLAVLGALALVYGNYRWYIGPETRREMWGFYPDTRVVGEYMNTILDDYEVYVADVYFPIDSLIFLTCHGGEFAPRFHHLWEKGHLILTMNLRPPAGKGVAFIAKPTQHYDPVYRGILRKYPGSVLVDLRETINDKNPDRVCARAVLIPPGALTGNLSAETPRERAREEARRAPRAFTGGRGSGPGLFDNLMDIAVDRKGNIYAVDMGNDRVQKFDAAGNFLFSWGVRGDGPGEFNEPRGIAVDRRGDVCVIDTWNHRVQKFSPEGKFLSAWTSPSGLYGPRGIAAGNARVYVADSGNGRIEVFDTKGRHRASWGKRGSSPGEFAEPVGVAVDGRGFVYVLDSGNCRVQKLDGTGRPVTSWRVEGWRDAN
ncbi:MAG: 6-bladed beta-propeller, partial [Candidatus Eisenbacteria bacterium]